MGSKLGNVTTQGNFLLPSGTLFTLYSCLTKLVSLRHKWKKDIKNLHWTYGLKYGIFFEVSSFHCFLCHPLKNVSSFFIQVSILSKKRNGGKSKTKCLPKHPKRKCSRGAHHLRGLFLLFVSDAFFLPVYFQKLQKSLPNKTQTTNIYAIQIYKKSFVLSVSFKYTFKSCVQHNFCCGYST